jgi:hypothetical protein
MDVGRNAVLGAIADDAVLERQDFIVQATEQLQRYLDANRERIEEIGGMTLIDDESDYLSIAPDLTFRSRSRYEDPETGEWSSETEIIEHPSELVELYNPADLFAWIHDAAVEAAGLEEQPTATDDLMDAAGISPEETMPVGAGLGDEAAAYAGAADEWAATQPAVAPATDEESAARGLYDLALEFQERSQTAEARLIEQFEEAAEDLTRRLGDLIVVDDEDERLVLAADGHFRAEVLPEDSEGEWRGLADPDELVEFYDPTDVFGDLADALAEAFPSVAPDLGGDAGDEDEEEVLAREPGEPVEDQEDQEDQEDLGPSGNGRRP